MYNTFQVYFFGGYQWKAFLQVEPHLVTKHTPGAGAGTVGFLRPIRNNMP
jgi:hypothetical protein